MNRFKNFAKLFAAAIIACCAFIAMAHDAWVLPGKGPVYQILYGHQVTENYDTIKVTSVNAFDAAQQPLSFTRIVTDSGVSIKINRRKPALFALEFDNGYWVKVDGESKNIRKSKMPEGTDPAHTLKFSKTIISWHTWMTKPLGQRVEFIPVSAAKAPKAGDQIKLQLLLDGKPLPGLMVENNSNKMGPLTDDSGFVTVTVIKGANRFTSVHNISQPDEADAQRLSLTGALVFTVK